MNVAMNKLSLANQASPKRQVTQQLHHHTADELELQLMQEFGMRFKTARVIADMGRQKLSSSSNNKTELREECRRLVASSAVAEDVGDSGRRKFLDYQEGSSSSSSSSCSADTFLYSPKRTTIRSFKVAAPDKPETSITKQITFVPLTEAGVTEDAGKSSSSTDTISIRTQQSQLQINCSSASADPDSADREVQGNSDQSESTGRSREADRISPAPLESESKDGYASGQRAASAEESKQSSAEGVTDDQCAQSYEDDEESLSLLHHDEYSIIEEEEDSDDDSTCSDFRGMCMPAALMGSLKHHHAIGDHEPSESESASESAGSVMTTETNYISLVPDPPPSFEDEDIPTPTISNKHRRAAAQAEVRSAQQQGEKREEKAQPEQPQDDSESLTHEEATVVTETGSEGKLHKSGNTHTQQQCATCNAAGYHSSGRWGSIGSQNPLFQLEEDSMLAHALSMHSLVSYATSCSSRRSSLSSCSTFASHSRRGSMASSCSRSSGYSSRRSSVSSCSTSTAAGRGMSVTAAYLHPRQQGVTASTQAMSSSISSLSGFLETLNLQRAEQHRHGSMTLNESCCHLELVSDNPIQSVDQAVHFVLARSLSEENLDASCATFSEEANEDLWDLDEIQEYHQNLKRRQQQLQQQQYYYLLSTANDAAPANPSTNNLPTAGASSLPFASAARESVPGTRRGGLGPGVGSYSRYGAIRGSLMGSNPTGLLASPEARRRSVSSSSIAIMPPALHEVAEVDFDAEQGPPDHETMSSVDARTAPPNYPSRRCSMSSDMPAMDPTSPPPVKGVAERMEPIEGDSSSASMNASGNYQPLAWELAGAVAAAVDGYASPGEIRPEIESATRLPSRRPFAVSDDNSTSSSSSTTLSTAASPSNLPFRLLGRQDDKIFPKAVAAGSSSSSGVVHPPKFPKRRPG